MLCALFSLRRRCRVNGFDQCHVTATPTGDVPANACSMHCVSLSRYYLTYHWLYTCRPLRLSLRHFTLLPAVSLHALSILALLTCRFHFPPFPYRVRCFRYLRIPDPIVSITRAFSLPAVDLLSHNTCKTANVNHSYINNVVRINNNKKANIKEKT